MPIKKVIVEKANRMYQLPPGILSFARLEAKRGLLRKAELYDLARFNWPIEPETSQAHGSSGLVPASNKQLDDLKEELANWYAGIHGAKLNPAREVFIGGSISNLLFNLALAFIDEGDIAFVPDLGLPLYKKVIAACGGEPVTYTVSPKNEWRPSFRRVETRLGRVARMMFVNIPHNPTGAILDEKEIADLIWLAGRENIIVICDAAYQTVSERKIVSLMSVGGGKKVGVEVGSFAYHFGLPALPFGFVVGNREIISGLEMATSITQIYIPDFWIDMALTAIRRYPHEGIKNIRRHITQSSGGATRLLELLKLERSGLETLPFVWARIGKRRQSVRTANRIFRRSRVLVAPGIAFGETGEGFLRLSLTAAPQTYAAACDRLKRKGVLNVRRKNG